MIRFFRRLWQDKRGNALVLLAAAFPLLVGSAGLATDTIQWTLWKRELQRAADSAAMAGVYDRISNGGDASNVSTAVCNDLAQDNHTIAGTGCSNLLEDPTIDTNAIASQPTWRDPVKVTLRVQHSLPFSSIFLSTPPIISATAIAASISSAEYCVVALDSSASAVGIEIGGSASVDMGDCSLMANSTNPNNAATNTGNASNVTAASLDAAGGVQHSASWDVDSYNPYSAPIADPFATLPMPTSSAACNKTWSPPNSGSVDRKNGAVKDVAGDVVCINGGFTIKGTDVLGPATYVINGGDLTMTATGNSLSCNGCTILMTKFSNPAQTGNIKLTGGTIDIKAPTTGTYAGVAFYQDRNATACSGNSCNKVNGTNGAKVTGVVYIPNQGLTYNGGGSATYQCLQIVAKTVSFSGNSKILKGSDSTCGLAGLGGIGGAARVRLVA